ncbi:MAG: hypothetical protein IKW58_00005 [Alphaproteobacteria bacterium]|jgi:hypothetical protein|nr:hypothetical protein [Alphaproteobacteria bacterium]
MAKSEMDFRNFYEFIDFCRNVDIKNWSEIEVREFNKKVYSLMKDDISFKEKYTKLSAKLKKQDVRDNILKQRTKISLNTKRETYRKNQTAYKICSSQGITR